MAMYGALGPLVPTYTKCFVQDAQDALLLVQAVVDHRLFPVERRPQDQERAELIKSGNIFIFDEKRGQIQRWTDGIAWSPSRISGEFLIYRERKQGQRSTQSTHGSSNYSKKPLSNTESKSTIGGSVAKKILPSRHRLCISGDAYEMMMPMDGSHYMSYHGPNIGSHSYSPQYPFSHSGRSQSAEYNLYGSLTSNEQYKENGSIKKTISIPYKSSSYRLISYYFPEDVEAQRLTIPSEDPKFADINIQPELAETKNVKSSITINPHDVGLNTPYSQGMNPYSPYQSRSSLAQQVYSTPVPQYGAPMVAYRQNASIPMNNYSRSDLQQQSLPCASDQYTYTPVDSSVNRASAQAANNYSTTDYYGNSSRTTASIPGHMQYANTQYHEVYEGRSQSQPSLPSTLPNLNISKPYTQTRENDNWGSVQSSANGYHDNRPHSTVVTETKVTDKDISSSNGNSSSDSSNTSSSNSSSGNTSATSNDSVASANMLNETEQKMSDIPGQSTPVKTEELLNPTNTTRSEFDPSNITASLFETVDITSAGANSVRNNGRQTPGLSASIIAQDSDGYEPIYDSTSPSSDSHINDTEVDTKEFAHGNIMSHYSHNGLVQNTENQPSPASQRIFMTATTTAPYDIQSM